MARFVRLSAAGALTVLLVAGCGGSHHPAGKPAIVVAHPQVQTNGISKSALAGKQAALLSPSKLAFMTSGSDSCVWLPSRLTILDPSSIRLDMRVEGVVAKCTGGAVGFPIAVTIDPRHVDFHQPLSVVLAYKVDLGGTQGTKQWSRTVVAPAFRG